MLLHVEGEARQQHWARCYFRNLTILHGASMLGTFATMSVLLAAGADENATAADTGLSPYVYIAPCSCSRRKWDRADEAARCRMLARGPAFRARSWASYCCCPKGGGRRWLTGWWRSFDRRRASPSPKDPPPWVGVRVYRSESRRSTMCRLCWQVRSLGQRAKEGAGQQTMQGGCEWLRGSFAGRGYAVQVTIGMVRYVDRRQRQGERWEGEKDGTTSTTNIIAAAMGC